MYQSIITEVDDCVGLLTLNRADRHNALDETLVAELDDALREFDDDARVRVVVLSSTGKTFCAGADINALRRAAAQSEAENLADAHDVARLLTTLDQLGKPTIARVLGSAFGAGLGLIAACDIALATYDVQFALTEVKQGVVAALIAPYLVAAIGPRQFRRFMLTAERFSAAEAYRIGLQHEVVPGEEQLDEAIGEIIDNLQKGGPTAQAESKALLRTVWAAIDGHASDEAAHCYARVLSGVEGAQGLAAFLDKRKPNWIE